MNGRQRAEAVRDVAECVSLWNEVRTDDFQDHVIRLVNSTREHLRDADGELPRRGTDPLDDALMGIADVADASPLAVRDACARVLEAAEEVTSRV